jgi:hypothetical protein
MFDQFNRVTTFLFNILLWPFSALPPVWGLLFISILTGLLMLGLFKKVSNQSGIRQTKDRIRAHLLGLRLYQNDPRASVQCVMNMLWQNGRYLGYALQPLLIMMIPVLLIIFQLNARFGRRPFHAGEQGIVSVCLEAESNKKTVELNAGPGISIETPALWSPQEHSFSWRIRALQRGQSTLQVGSIRKTVWVEDRSRTLVSAVYPPGNVHTLFYPGEKAIPHNRDIKSVTVEYPQQTFNWAGMHFHWFILFLIFSIISGYALKKPLGVEI